MRLICNITSFRGFMRKFAVSLVALATIAIFVSGCASYKASALANLDAEIISQSPHTGSSDIMAGAKAFNKSDCKKYLDRDVISEGYQPVQLFIQNGSDKDYVFSLSRISLPTARAEEVAEKVHTNTAGRAAGYGAAAWLTFGILAVPAIVDGIKSSNANEALDNDFSAKTAHDQIVFHHSHFNKILFVPVNEYQPTFTITLVEQNSNTSKTLNVTVRG